jgi:hypothetical protein
MVYGGLYLSVIDGDTGSLDFKCSQSDPVYTYHSSNSKSAEIRLNNSTETNHTKLKAASSLSSNTSFILPNSNGTSGYILSTDGNGNTSWIPDNSLNSVLPKGGGFTNNNALLKTDTSVSDKTITDVTGWSIAPDNTLSGTSGIVIDGGYHHKTNTGTTVDSWRLTFSATSMQIWGSTGSGWILKMEIDK